MTASESLSGQDFLWVLGSLCQLYRIPFAPALLQQQFPPPYDRTTILGAAKALDFKVGEKTVSAKELASVPLPCLVFLRQAPAEPGALPSAGADAAASEAPRSKPALLVKANDTELLYFEAGSNTPLTMPAAEFESRLEPEIMLFARSSAEATDTDMPTAAQPFGFKWFIPELLKHKKIWREVLSASLAIQLVALATPLFTQVVIDKVVVHHTRNTLWVVGIALVMFMVFSAVMTWMRQYLVLHTGNRVDAVLGQTVFRHLFRLPMPYF